MRDLDTIILHCSYTKPSMNIGAAEIRDWHVNTNGWADIGYHYIIRRDGVLETGRPLDQIGAHAKGHNTGTIGVCLVGGMSDAGKPDCNFTTVQWASLEELVVDLLEQHLDIMKVIGHRDVDDGKECPCFDVAAWASQLKEMR